MQQGTMGGNGALLFWVSQEKVKAVFDNLIQLEHLNIVKFHKYWADVKENKARVRDESNPFPVHPGALWGQGEAVGNVSSCPCR